MQIGDIYTYGHILGVFIGAGAAFTGDFLFLKSVRDGVITPSEMRSIKRTSKFVWFGLAIIVLFGIGLFSLDTARYLDSAKFLSKMSIVAILTLNGVIFHLMHIPTLLQHVDLDLKNSFHFQQRRKFLLISGAISSTSWLSALALGSLRKLPYSYVEIMGVYLLVVLGAICTALFLKKYLIPGN